MLRQRRDLPRKDGTSRSEEEKTGGGVATRGDTSYSSPSSPTQVHTHCRSEGRALRASPCLRQGAHMPGARRRTQRKESALKCTCSPRAGLCLAVTVRGALERGTAAGKLADTARPGDPCL
ncbi:hypothetical protein NN561_014980 [Cricetulus griseus]